MSLSTLTLRHILGAFFRSFGFRFWFRVRVHRAPGISSAKLTNALEFPGKGMPNAMSLVLWCNDQCNLSKPPSPGSVGDCAMWCFHGAV